MAKLRKIASIERGIEEILQVLSENEQDTIGKRCRVTFENVVIQTGMLKAKTLRA